MKTNWKSIVHRNNAETFVLPEGWASQEEVSADLGCNPGNTRKTMAPLVKARVVEQKQFVLWDRELERLVRVVAYKQVEKPVKKKV